MVIFTLNSVKKNWKMQKKIFFKKKIWLGGGLARSVLAALWSAIDFSSS